MKVKFYSARLLLREFMDEDLELVHHLDSDPVIMRYIGKPLTREQSKKRLAKAILEYQNGNGLGKWMAVEKDTNKPIGWFVLDYLDNTDWVEIGYRLKKDFWGEGYATEMSRKLLEYGFNTLGLEQIVGVTHQENEASKRVLQKLGLNYKGIRHFYGIDCSFFEISRLQNDQ